jgi:uncharacterized protein YkwD
MLIKGFIIFSAMCKKIHVYPSQLDSIMLAISTIDLVPMKLVGKLWLSAIVCCSLLLLNSSPLAALAVSKQIQHTALEKGILAEMNRVRANPVGYAKFLQAWRKRFQGKQAKLSPSLFLQTREGTTAVDEAIRAVRKIEPVPPLRLSVGMSIAAREHVIYQGKRGLIGHKGRGGSMPYARINRHGRWLKVAGENNSYGPDTAAAVVRDLIVDDGVPDRGHRINMFRADYRVAGIACGYHKNYRTMCVIDYAGGFQEKR